VDLAAEINKTVTSQTLKNQKSSQRKTNQAKPLMITTTGNQATRLQGADC